MLVRELMTAPPEIVTPELDLAELAEIMEQRRIRHAPVVNDEGQLVGLVSHRDLVQGALRERDATLSEQREALELRSVEDVMTREPQTIDPDDDVKAAASLMLENKYGCLPVMDNERLVGILTEADFVRYAAETGLS